MADKGLVAGQRLADSRYQAVCEGRVPTRQHHYEFESMQGRLASTLSLSRRARVGKSWTGTGEAAGVSGLATSATAVRATVRKLGP